MFFCLSGGGRTSNGRSRLPRGCRPQPPRAAPWQGEPRSSAESSYADPQQGRIPGKSALRAPKPPARPLGRALPALKRHVSSGGPKAAILFNFNRKIDNLSLGELPQGPEGFVARRAVAKMPAELRADANTATSRDALENKADRRSPVDEIEAVLVRSRQSDTNELDSPARPIPLRDLSVRYHEERRTRSSRASRTLILVGRHRRSRCGSSSVGHGVTRCRWPPYCP